MFFNSGTQPIVDYTSWPGWALFQSDSTLAQSFGYSQTFTPATNMTFVVKFLVPGANSNTQWQNNEGDFAILLSNSADSNEHIQAWAIETDGSDGAPFQFQVENNGTPTIQNFGASTTLLPQFDMMVLYKVSNDYWLMLMSSHGGRFVIFPSAATKTGVTTFDTFEIAISTANNGVSPWWGIDYIHVYDSNVLPPLNP